MSRLGHTSIVLSMALLVVLVGSKAYGAGKGSNPNGKPFIAIQGQIVEVEGKLSSLQDQIDALVTRVDTIEQRVGANEAAITSLQTQNANLQAQINANADDIESLQAKITALQAANVVLQDKITANTGDITALKQQLATNNGLIANFQQAVSDLGVSLQSHINHNNLLIAALDQEIDAINLVLAWKQMIVSGSCQPGESIRQINTDGSVVCEVDNAGSAVNIQQYRVYNFVEVLQGNTRSIETVCPSGFMLMGGGHYMWPNGIVGAYPVIYSNSFTADTRWRVEGRNDSTFVTYVNNMALCIRITTP